MEPIIIGVIVFGVVAYTFGVYMVCTRLCRRNVDPLLVNPDYVDFTTVYPENKYDVATIQRECVSIEY